MLRIGTLLPRSTLFPALAVDFLNGLKDNLKRQDIFEQVKFVTDNIGFGTNEQDIYSKAEKLLLEEDVDMVIAFADARITEMLQPLFTANNKILLVVNLGANFPDSWQAAPTTIQHTLNFCMQTALTGKLAAAEENKQAVNVLSYYDGGYRQCFCMLNQHQANGGIPAYNHVTHININEFTIEPVAVFLEQHAEVNTLLCLFSGDQAERFYQHIALLQQKINLTLYVAPMMLDIALKKNLGPDFTIDKVKGYIPWHTSLTNTSNSLFIDNCKVNGRQANYFSLLGWDTAFIVTEVYRQIITGNNNATVIVQSLSKIVFDSPRGWMKIDPTTNYTYGPAYLATCSGNMNITLDKENETEESSWETFKQQAVLNGESSSWRNTYLCI